MDWYSSLQAFIDMFFNSLGSITVLGFIVIVILLVRKMTPKRKKGGLF
jgi:flagellar biogenesis protein FliO